MDRCYVFGLVSGAFVVFNIAVVVAASLVVHSVVVVAIVTSSDPQP